LGQTGVISFLIPPLLLDWGANLGRPLLLTSSALRHWDKVVIEWKTRPLEGFGIALVAALSYIFVLTRFSLWPSVMWHLRGKSAFSLAPPWGPAC